ncbi:MAG: ribosome-associated translation inhibitor RaiA [Planctomycetota bacterium]
MQVNITARHADLTPPIEEYVQKKAEKMVKYFDRTQQIDVIVDKSKKAYRVEFIVDVEKHEPFVAHCDDEDLYACIDHCADRATRMLKDHKSKLRDNKHHTPTSGLEL